MSEIKNSNGVITLTSGFINIESTGSTGINLGATSINFVSTQSVNLNHNAGSTSDNFIIQEKGLATLVLQSDAGGTGQTDQAIYINAPNGNIHIESNPDGFINIESSNINFIGTVDFAQTTFANISSDDIPEGSVNLYLNGKTSDDLPEGITNLYFSGKTADDLPEGITNLYFNGKTADDLPEGTTNLYFNGKTADDLPEGITNLYFSGKTADDLPEGITNLYFSGKTADDLPEGITNLYFNGKNTDDLPEGITNLYFTTDRGISAIELAGTITFDPTQSILLTHTSDALTKPFTIEEAGYSDMVIQSSGATNNLILQSINGNVTVESNGTGTSALHFISTVGGAQLTSGGGAFHIDSVNNNEIYLNATSNLNLNSTATILMQSGFENYIQLSTHDSDGVSYLNTGDIRLNCGIAGTSGYAGSILLNAGWGDSSDSKGGNIELTAGYSKETKTGGEIKIYAGNVLSQDLGTGTGTGGSIYMIAGQSRVGNGGSLLISGGNAEGRPDDSSYGVTGNGGDVYINGSNSDHIDTPNSDHNSRGLGHNGGNVKIFGGSTINGSTGLPGNVSIKAGYNITTGVTGNIDISSNIFTVDAGAVYSIQNLTSSGDISLNTLVTTFDTSVGDITATLGDGTNGQMKVLTLINDTNTVSLTSPGITALGFTSLTLDTLGSCVTLLSTTNGWVIVNERNTRIV